MSFRGDPHDNFHSVFSILLAIVAAALYCVASARLYHALRHPRTVECRGVPQGRGLTLMLALAALLLHAWLLAMQTGLPGTLRLPFFTALSATALGIVLLQLALCLRQPADYLGLAAYPLAATVLLASQLAGFSPMGHAPSVLVHILLSLLAYAVLGLATAQAILVSVQRRRLSAHRPGGIVHALPPLEKTESLLFALLIVGFILLTLSLASGFFYLEDMFAQKLVHKTVLSGLAWLAYGLLLFGRWRFGWRGRRAVTWTIAASILLMLAYFGSKLVLEILLRPT